MMPRWLRWAILALVMIFLIGPFFVIAAAALHGGETLAFPPKDLTLKWVWKVFEVESFRASFGLSILLAIGGTLLALILGVPAAYALDRFRPKGSEAIRLMVTAPIIVPGIIVGLALLRYLVIPVDLPMIAALFVAHTALLIPYAVRVVSASLANLRVDIEEAAVLLGCSRIGAFVRVTLPNIKSGIFAAFILGFVTSFNQVPISLFLAGPGVSTLPIDMLWFMEFTYDPSVAALSALLALMSMAVVLVAERLLGFSRYV